MNAEHTPIYLTNSCEVSYRLPYLQSPKLPRTTKGKLSVLLQTISFWKTIAINFAQEVLSKMAQHITLSVKRLNICKALGNPQVEHTIQINYWNVGQMSAVVQKNLRTLIFVTSTILIPAPVIHYITLLSLLLFLAEIALITNL